ncbi:hypothetical protein GCM10009592_28610 [Brachybacterium rhamnosum]|uniref:DUF4355 domain-containing protein n=1 Tax=Brachybacterium rhamnosum TaxID=173361 RepID=A0ABW4Q017_9MICO
MDRNLLNLLQTIGALRFVDSPDENGGGSDEPAGDDQGDDGDEDEPLGENGIKALKSERLRASQAKKRADAAEARLKEIEDAEKTELQRAQERISELEKANKDFEDAKRRTELRASVLAEKNVPSEWADFVTGDTEDEMTKAADRILANLSRADKGPSLRPTAGQTGGSLEAGREAAKSFRP